MLTYPSSAAARTALVSVGPAEWLLPIAGRKPVKLIANDVILAGFDDKVFEQAVNTAEAPGVEQVVIGADAHVGFDAFYLAICQWVGCADANIGLNSVQIACNCLAWNQTHSIRSRADAVVNRESHSRAAISNSALASRQPSTEHVSQTLHSWRRHAGCRSQGPAVRTTTGEVALRSSIATSARRSCVATTGLVSVAAVRPRANATPFTARSTMMKPGHGWPRHTRHETLQPTTASLHVILLLSVLVRSVSGPPGVQKSRRSLSSVSSSLVVTRSASKTTPRSSKSSRDGSPSGGCHLSLPSRSVASGLTSLRTGSTVLSATVTSGTPTLDTTHQTGSIQRPGSAPVTNGRRMRSAASRWLAQAITSSPCGRRRYTDTPITRGRSCVYTLAWKRMRTQMTGTLSAHGTETARFIIKDMDQSAEGSA